MNRICISTIISCLFAITAVEAMPDRDLLGRLKREADQKKACLLSVKEAENDCYDVCEMLEENHFSDEEIESCVEACFYHAKEERKRCIAQHGSAPKLSFRAR